MITRFDGPKPAHSVILTEIANLRAKQLAGEGWDPKCEDPRQCLLVAATNIVAAIERMDVLLKGK
jgi:hypothetical protein